MVPEPFACLDRGVCRFVLQGCGGRIPGVVQFVCHLDSCVGVCYNAMGTHNRVGLGWGSPRKTISYSCCTRFWQQDLCELLKIVQYLYVLYRQQYIEAGPVYLYGYTLWGRETRF